MDGARARRDDGRTGDGDGQPSLSSEGLESQRQNQLRMRKFKLQPAPPSHRKRVMQTLRIAHANTAMEIDIRYI